MAWLKAARAHALATYIRLGFVRLPIRYCGAFAQARLKILVFEWDFFTGLVRGEKIAVVLRVGRVFAAYR